MSNELIVIENVELVPFFTKGENLDSVLSQIEKEAMSFVHGDLSVKKNRDAVKAMVTKVTKSKTYLESQGKELAAEYKAIPKRIDENRKKTKDFLTELQAKVRQPLTEWEQEQARLEEENRIAEEKEKLRLQVEADHEIALLMNREFDREAEEVKKAEQEAERLRKEQEEKERLEREARIAQEAKEKAEREAKEREERLIREAKEREEAAECERLAAIEREKEAERQRIAAEERARLQAEQAERDRLAEIDRQKQADIDSENKRLADVEAAKQAEIQRQKDEAARLERERLQKEANKKHAAKIHNEMMQAAISNGIPEEQAKAFVILLAKGVIPHIGKVQY